METILNMSLGSLVGSGVGILVLLSVFIEITPIKVNPVSGFLKWLGGKINGDVLDEVEALKRELAKMQSAQEEQVVISSRYRILRFGDEVLHDVRHSKDHFEQILLDISAYNRYCEKHEDFANNITQTTAQIILERYKLCLEENSFI